MRVSGVPISAWAFLLTAFMTMQACTQTATTNLVLTMGQTSIPLTIVAHGLVKPSVLVEHDRQELAVQNEFLDHLTEKIQTGKQKLFPGDRYQTASMVDVPGNSCLFLTIISTAPVIKCELFSGNNQSAINQVLLFPPFQTGKVKPYTFSIPLGSITAFSGFQLSVPGLDQSLSLISAEIARIQSNYWSQDNPDLIPADFRFMHSKELIQCQLPETAWIPGELAWLDLEYEFQTPSVVQPPSVSLRLSSKAFNMRLLPGRHHIQLYSQILGFKPDRLQISGLAEGFRILAVTPLGQPKNSGLASPRKPENGFTAPVPLPADLWSLLHNPVNSWRQDFMEVYSWNLFPEIIIIDFGSLKIQDRFMKRMIYFTEKKGYRGKLLKNSEIDSKHGWNANDFSADSIANFFNTAESSGFALNEEETFFLECLIQWGIISVRNHHYLPIHGGVLSVAHGAGMSELNRTLLLQHECMHGVFFAQAEFRKICETAFATMNPAARAFLIKYFSFYQYDPDDHNLMVNEMQAYLLQQELGALKTYIKGNMVNAYARELPGLAGAFRKESRDNLDEIYEIARFLSNELMHKTGLVNGQMASLVPQDSN